MERSQIEFFASELYEANRSGAPIKPITSSGFEVSADDAYAIQLENVNREKASGGIVSGKKIGLTSPGMQKLFGVNEPDYGHLFASMLCPGGIAEMDGLIQPKIEAEIAFVLKKGIKGGNVTREEVIEATDYITACFEIVDSRIEGWNIKLADTIADNASSGRYVLSGKAVSPKSVDMPRIHMSLYKSGKLENEGTADAVLGDPAVSVAWLANCLARYGSHFEAGDVILSGGITAAPFAQRGDEFEAVFSELGTVYAKFV